MSSEQLLRLVELEADIQGIDDIEPLDVAELIPHPRQMTIYDVLSADDLRHYLGAS